MIRITRDGVELLLRDDRGTGEQGVITAEPSAVRWG
jgi:hypothetical protein